VTAKIKPVDAATAKVILDSGAHMIDVRSKDEWSAGHVEGSDRVAANAVGSKTIGRADAVITVCRTGSKSKRAAKKLAKEGYRVYHLTGGLKGWKELGLPLVSTNGNRPTVA
jgi:rhodanese-related sulfurtransferase